MAAMPPTLQWGWSGRTIVCCVRLSELPELCPEASDCFWCDRSRLSPQGAWDVRCSRPLSSITGPLLQSSPLPGHRPAAHSAWPPSPASILFLPSQRRPGPAGRHLLWGRSSQVFRGTLPRLTPTDRQGPPTLLIYWSSSHSQASLPPLILHGACRLPCLQLCLW